MAYVRYISGKNAPSGGRGSSQRSFGKIVPRIVPWVAIPGIGVAFAVWSLTIVSDLYSANRPTVSKEGFRTIAASLGPANNPPVFKPVAYDQSASRDEAERHALSARVAAATQEKRVRVRTALQTRFDQVAARAALTSEKLALLFGDLGGDEGAEPAGMTAKAVASAQARKATKVAALVPGTARFGTSVSDPALSRFGNPNAEDIAAISGLALAYAEPQPSHATDALSNLLTLPDEDADEAQGALPDYEATPDNIPLPRSRPMPNKERAGKLTSAPAELNDDDNGRKPAAKRSEFERRQPPQVQQAKRATQGNPRLAYANPDDPAGNGASGGGLGQAFRNLFGGGSGAGSGRARAGGVAVYDISAAKVYMPDGSVLEAHSGIGEMADNPRYVDKRMNGPTPPHTYNLKLRESRFHGVEAIRMIPVDGKNRYGRTGILAHSYLLRGRRAQSHGCVAFANYPQFLKAFKQGKVKQIVVVPGGGRATATRIASNGRGV